MLGPANEIVRSAQMQAWTRLESGEPVCDGVRAWVGCEITELVPAGKSTVHFARALESRVAHDVALGEAGDALAYHIRSWHRLGRSSRIED